MEKEEPNGKTKKFRRRLYIMKVVKKPSPENEDGVNYEEEEINDENPDDPEKYDPEVYITLRHVLLFVYQVIRDLPG